MTKKCGILSPLMGFASRRNSRYYIHLAAQETLNTNRSRSSSVEPTNTAINEDAKTRRAGLGLGGRSWPAFPPCQYLPIPQKIAGTERHDFKQSSASLERPPYGNLNSIHQQHGRLSVAAFPLSPTSSSGYFSPMASARSQRGSLAGLLRSV